jgi:hypothetical protein
MVAYKSVTIEFMALWVVPWSVIVGYFCFGGRVEDGSNSISS